MLFVSFHDDGGGERNIAAYEDDGTPIVDKVLIGPVPAVDAELRGLCFVLPDILWALNGASKNSEIMGFARLAPTVYKFFGQVTSYAAVDSLWHPFDITFSNQNEKLYCYVSNQDTNVVARLEVGARVQPAPTAPALPKGGKFLEGTFVASSTEKLPGVKKETTPILPGAGGLEVELDKGGKKVLHSVRGVVWANGALYVADEPGNAIKVYNAEGGFLKPATQLHTPVHLLAHEDERTGAETLYVTGKRGVFWAPLRKGSPEKLEFPTTPGIEWPGASGMAFGSDGSFYVANRESRQVRRFENFSPNPSDTPIPSVTFEVFPEPEFILYVAD